MARQNIRWGREPFDLEGIAEWVISAAEEILDEVKDLKYDKVATEFKFINTDYKLGLTSANVDEAIKFLNND